MTFQPYQIYTPTRTTDGAGGYTEALITARTIWASTQIHNTEITLTADAREVVLPDDVVVISAEQYRVRRGTLSSNAQWKQYTLVKVDRPIRV